MSKYQLYRGDFMNRFIRRFLFVLLVFIFLIINPLPTSPGMGHVSHIPEALCGENWDSPFGVFNDIEVIKGKLGLSYAKELGIKYTRLGLFWEMVEPVEGKYNWILTDRIINEHVKAGISPLVTVKCISRWGANSGGRGVYSKFRSGPPKSMKKYRKFIRTLATRYKGKVKYWQIENEVFDKTLYNSPFWNGTKEEYIELLKAAHEEIKKADPGAKVVMAGFANFLFVKYREGNPHAKMFFEYLLDKGRKYYDVIDFHQYFTPDYLYDELVIINKTMRKLGLKKKLITTEAGDFDIRLFAVQIANPGKKIPIVQKFLRIPSVNRKLREYMKGGVTKRERDKFSVFLKRDPTAGPILERYQAENLAKRLCINLSHGVKQFYWAWMMDQDNPIDWYMGHMCLADSDGRKKPHFYTYKLLIKKLKGFRNVKEIHVRKGIRLFSYTFAGNRKLFIMWSDSGKQKIDLRPYISASKIKVTRIIVRRGKTGRDAVIEMIKPGLITLTVTPVIVEAGDGK